LERRKLMTIMRNLTLFMLLVIATGFLASCVPVPPYDPALSQQGVYVQQAAAPEPLPTVTVAASLAQVEPTATVVTPVRVEPTGTPAPLVQPGPTATATTSVQVEPTSTQVTLAEIEPTGTAVTVTIALAQLSDAQVMVAQAPTEAPVLTLTPTASVTRAPTFTPQPTRTVAPTSTRVPTTRAVVSTAAPAPAATVDQHLIVITEEDITAAVASGAGAQQGATVDNLQVRFADGKTHITADRLGYGIIKMQNLDLVGRLVAQNGVLSLAVESISPRGLAANFLPAAVNQALASYGSQWYVEDVRTLDGRVELRVR
jgi:hypothetical protein